jgi:KUP system potassium uptake protein
MLIWHRGAEVVTARLQECVVPIGTFMADILQKHIPRVPGTVIFFTRTKQDVPSVMIWHVKQNRSLHERLFVLSVVTESIPCDDNSSRLTFTEIAP